VSLKLLLLFQDKMQEIKRAKRRSLRAITLKQSRSDKCEKQTTNTLTDKGFAGLDT